MIAFVKGTIEDFSERSVLVDVNGVGYKVFCIEREYTKLRGKTGQEVFLHTHYHLRENAAELYGFLERAECDMFEILIGISGIGPKGALNILNAAPLDVLQRAIAAGDTSVLTKVSGIGNRIAQKIILELKDTFGEVWGALPGDIKRESDVVEALESLGYSRGQVQEVLRQLPEGVEKTEDKIKEALKLLGK